MSKRAGNVNNLTPFSKEYQPEKNGRKKGIKNRKTIIKEVLSMVAVLPKNQIEHLTQIYPGVQNNMTNAEIMAIVQAHKAIVSQDTGAFKTLMDYAPEVFEDEDTTEKMILIELRDTIIEKHYRHFSSGFDWTISMGGSRSGKTYNFIKWALLQTYLGKFDLSIIAPSHKTLELGAFADVRDIFTKYVPDVEIPKRPTYIEVNGSRWQFEVVTSENEAKRNRGNVFINEADGIPVEVANIIGRASGRKFIDFNPVKRFWAHKYINEDKSNLLVSTWQDNPYLSANQLQWFEDLRKFGENAEQGSPERYAYEVYYLGDYSMMGGKAFDSTDFDVIDEAPKCDYYISYSDTSLGDGGDFWATLLFGVKGKEIYAIDCIFSQYVKVTGFVEKLKEWDKKYLVDHYSEINGVSGISTKASQAIYDNRIIPVNNTDNKRGDILVYAPFAKKVKFVKSNSMGLFLAQCANFPNDQHDDAPDCLCRGVKIIKKYFDI